MCARRLFQVRRGAIGTHKGPSLPISPEGVEEGLDGSNHEGLDTQAAVDASSSRALLASGYGVQYLFGKII
jgi:hypothetical protein